MKTPSERTVRRWRSAVKDTQAFFIKFDQLNIFVDRGGNASRITVSGLYDDPLGKALDVISDIERGRFEHLISPGVGYAGRGSISDFTSNLGDDSSDPKADDGSETGPSTQVSNTPVVISEDTLEDTPDNIEISGRRGRGKSQELARQCSALKKAGKTNKEIAEVIGFKNLSSVYDYLRLAAKLGV